MQSLSHDNYNLRVLYQPAYPSDDPLDATVILYHSANALRFFDGLSMSPEVREYTSELSMKSFMEIMWGKSLYDKMHLFDDLQQLLVEYARKNDIPNLSVDYTVQLN